MKISKTIYILLPVMCGLIWWGILVMRFKGDLRNVMSRSNEIMPGVLEEFNEAYTYAVYKQDSSEIIVVLRARAGHGCSIYLCDSDEKIWRYTGKNGFHEIAHSFSDLQLPADEWEVSSVSDCLWMGF